MLLDCQLEYRKFKSYTFSIKNPITRTQQIWCSTVEEMTLLNFIFLYLNDFRDTHSFVHGKGESLEIQRLFKLYLGSSTTQTKTKRRFICKYHEIN